MKIWRIYLKNKKIEIDLFEMNRNVKKLNERLRELSVLLVRAEDKDKNNIKIKKAKLNQVLQENFKKLVSIIHVF